MADLHLSHPTGRVIGRISVPGSKSESNRLLILKALYAPDLELEGLSTSNDTRVLQKLLEAYRDGQVLSAEDAGTAMRFGLAFLATQSGSWEIDGSARMRERPLGVLGEALQKLGAEVEYLKKPGYPPLRIKGGHLQGGSLKVDGSQSSQFISALMMIGPSLPQGLEIQIDGFSVSTPYIYLTANIMRRLGLAAHILGDKIVIPAREQNYRPPQSFSIEPDWSAASYWYLLALLAQKAEIYLPGFRQHSLQGDSFVANLFAPLGIDSHFIGAGFRLKRTEASQSSFDINLVHNPDLAQTMAVAFAAMNYPARIKGLQTLRIKETDRLAALQNELSKTGAQIEVGEDFLEIKRGVQRVEGLRFETYGDHRMAMALAPLALLGEITIARPEVVNKSYGSFWQDLAKVKFDLPR